MGEKVTAGMATTGERASLVDSIRSICTQVDELTVYCNNGLFPKIFDKPDNVNFIYDKSLGDIGDLGKFYSLRNKSGLLMTVDDDIVYPNNYVKTLKTRVSKQKIVGVHGTVFNFPILDFYTKNRNVYHFADQCTEEIEVDVLGTGTTMFTHELLENLKIDSYLQYQNMADLLLLDLSLKKGVKRHIIKRPANWLKEIKNEKSIFAHSFLDKPSKFNTGYLQTYYINKLLKPPHNLKKSIPINFSQVVHINYFNNFFSKLNMSSEHYIVCKMEHYTKMGNWPVPLRLLSDLYFERGYFDGHYRNYDFNSLIDSNIMEKSPLNRLVTKKINIKKPVRTEEQMLKICEFCIKNKILKINIETENLNFKMSRTLNIKDKNLDARQIFDFFTQY